MSAATPVRWKATTSFSWLILAVMSFSRSSYAAPPRFSFFGRKSNSTTAITAPPSTDASSTAWSSFFTIDPSKILTTIIERGGLILPKSIQRELLAMSRVCHVDQVQWNPVLKQLLLINVTVTAPGMKEHSLRIGRAFVSWESYTKPCLNIEVDDVDMLLEFTNLLLTKNNWNELYKAGFPPPMLVVEGDGEPTSTYVRISSMDLSGTLRAHIRSRPLDGKDVCPPWILDLDTFDEWNDELQRLSQLNLIQTGRRGCTSLQLYDWVEKYVGGKVRATLSSTAYDLATQPFTDADTDTVKRAKGFLNQARKTFFSYAKLASNKKGKDLQDDVMDRMDSMGIKDKVLGVHATVSKFGNNLLNETDDSIDDTIQSTYENLRDAATQQLNTVKGALRAVEEADAGHPEIVFPPDR